MHKIAKPSKITIAIYTSWDNPCMAWITFANPLSGLNTTYSLISSKYAELKKCLRILEVILLFHGSWTSFYLSLWV